MSLDDDDDFWNTTDVKAFNFDDDEQQQQQQQQQHQEIKTLGSVLAAKPPSKKAFLKPSVIACKSDRIHDLIDQVNNTPMIQNVIPQDPKSYVRDIIHKRVPINFEPYKSKRDKLLLLDCAICCCDGDTITAATVFMARTLKSKIFIDELKKRPIAIDHHINYLEMTGRKREASELRVFRP